MSDQDCAEFCSFHPDLRLETTAAGDLLVQAPTYPKTGVRNLYLNLYLGRHLGNWEEPLGSWEEKDGRGITCDSSTGFVLPNGARRSPSLSWTLKSRIAELDSPEGFWHLCPDFVMELKSPTDRPRTLKAKMQEYLQNGAQLGWLIDPETRSVSIYRPTGEVEIHTNIDSLTAIEPLIGFTLDLVHVWNPF